MMEPKDFLQTIEFRRMREIQTDLLRRFIRLCEDHDIPYFAVYGTLLGACRNRGFIPWDDDVDVAVWRRDYDRLKEIAGSVEAPYHLVFPEDEDCDYYGGAIRFQNTDTTNINLDEFSVCDSYGIGIDIEVIDYTFSGILLQSCKNRLLQFVYDLVLMQKYGERHCCIRQQAKGRKWMLRGISSLLGRKRILHLVKRAETLHGFRESSCSIYVYHQHDNLQAAWFSETIRLPFEDFTIAAPAQYQECLNSFYGSRYHVPPPPDRQVPTHILGRYIDPYTPYRETIARLCRSMYAPEGKIFLIWGAGNMFEHFVRHFGQINMPDYLIDNDPVKWGTTRHGCPVCPPEILKQYRADEIHLVICNIYVSEISSQIRSMGDYEYSIYWENWVDAELGAGSKRNRAD